MTLVPITLNEVGWTPAPELTEEEVIELDRSFAQKPARIGLRKRPGSSWEIEGRGYAGAIALSTGRQLRITTKVPIDSMLYMLGFTRGVHKFFEPLSGYSKTEDFWEVIVREFATRTAALLRQGLHQGYLEVEDDALRAMRGRLMVPRQIRKNFVYRERLACRYAEFTPDLLMNRALRLATFLTAHLEYRDESIAAQLRRNGRLFGGVSMTPVTPAEVLSVPLDRLTEPYRLPLFLASLIIGSVTLHDEVGTSNFASYLVDMDQLFEQFVAAVLEEELAALGLRVLVQQDRSLDPEERLRVFTDVEIWRGRRRCLVILDTKYKQYGGIPEPEDRDQVIVYNLKVGAQRVVLLYPEAVSDVFSVPTMKIHVMGVDLSGTPSELHERVRTLAGELIAGLEDSESEKVAS